LINHETVFKEWKSDSDINHIASLIAVPLMVRIKEYNEKIILRRMKGGQITVESKSLSSQSTQFGFLKVDL